MESISFTLKPLPPFSLEFTVWALRRRPENLVDRWDGNTYSRVLSLEGKTVKVSVARSGSSEKPQLHVSISGKAALTQAVKSEISELLKKMFSIRTDLSGFYELAHKDKRLKPLAERFSGVKPPRFPTVFEALVNAMACQQVSLALGITLLNRLAASYGAAFDEEGEIHHAFPGPGDLAGLSQEDFRRLGFSRSKGRAIIELSRAITKKEINFENLMRMADDEAVEHLMEMRGVGRWSAEYALLRGLGRINVFPGDDVGAQKNLQEFMRLDTRPDYERIRKITSSWQPYAGFVYFHFLLNKLTTKGYVK
jgi:DNA-3-methyladenine glycosylase II